MLCQVTGRDVVAVKGVIEGEVEKLAGVVLRKRGEERAGKHDIMQVNVHTSRKRCKVN